MVAMALTIPPSASHAILSHVATISHDTLEGTHHKQLEVEAAPLQPTSQKYHHTAFVPHPFSSTWHISPASPRKIACAVSYCPQGQNGQLQRRPGRRYTRCWGFPTEVCDATSTQGSTTIPRERLSPAHTVRAQSSEIWSNPDCTCPIQHVGGVTLCSGRESTSSCLPAGPANWKQLYHPCGRTSTCLLLRSVRISIGWSRKNC
mmetsp:Transcript_29906/g.56081  ORF Transcript_29906/g.56081 Transcript_29906/m.56081 type:complete len:204 (+) Transcript_29906:156-767(+)